MLNKFKALFSSSNNLAHSFFHKTVQNSVSFEGNGVHSGKSACVTVQPAAVGEGIYFVRTDLEEHNRIPARFYNVSSTLMSTTLCNSFQVKISTIEHICAALFAEGITDASILVNGPEIPIMDGSSKVFSQKIRQAGFKTFNKLYKTIKIVEEIAVKQNQTYASFSPAHSREFIFAFNSYSPFSSYVKKEPLMFDLDHDNFELLSDARTFGLYEDAQKLLSAGLVQGASLENTVVLKEGHVLNEEGLRSENELLKHKILDAIGDISLAGFNIIGRFTGINSGHGLNNQLLHALTANPDAWHIVHE